MALNPFFLNGSQTEQSLVQTLINEQLRMYGIECYYLPRGYANVDNVIKEVIQSEFKNAYPIEAYLDTYEGYGGQGTILSKFGIEGRDDMKVIISRERYENYIAPLMECLPNLELTDRPKEGDLIYFPLGDRLFEIKYVEHEQPFYQLNKTYVYELSCELFRYEDEVLDTNIGEIDDEIEQLGYIQTLQMIGGVGNGSGQATAEAIMCDGGAINNIIITNMGCGYSEPPLIGFSSSPGIQPIGISTISDEFVACSGNKSGMVTDIYLSNAGCGYTEAPWIEIKPIPGDECAGGAEAIAEITQCRSVQKINVTNGGKGYTSAPIVTISGGSFDANFSSTLEFFDSTLYTFDRNRQEEELTFDNTNETFDSNVIRFNPSKPQCSFKGATAISAISAGIVTAVYLTYGGDGYVGTPEVIIEPPLPIGIGSTSSPSFGVGSYIFNEVVIGETSGTEARVKKWDANTNILEVSIVSGMFTPSEIIAGQESGARYALYQQEIDDLVDPYAQNDIFEEEALDVVDFSESNPFGFI